MSWYAFKLVRAYVRACVFVGTLCMGLCLRVHLLAHGSVYTHACKYSCQAFDVRYSRALLCPFLAGPPYLEHELPLSQFGNCSLPTAQVFSSQWPRMLAGGRTGFTWALGSAQGVSFQGLSSIKSLRMSSCFLMRTTNRAAFGTVYCEEGSLLT